MYEGDSWYNAFVPRASKPPPDKPSHARRESLLTQPSESQADVARPEALLETPHRHDHIHNHTNHTNNNINNTNNDNALASPPPATLARRAKSYSDFYALVRAHVDTERAHVHTKGAHVDTERARVHNDLTTELDLAAWYGAVSHDLLEASHDDYTLYQSQLHMTRTHLDNMAADTAQALDTLAALSDSFGLVDAQTTAFRTQCEGLMDDQKRITKLADDMEQNLRYYLYLEPTTKRLNAPGAAKIVRGSDFTHMLANLDSCLEYMHAHANHREADTYRSRYRLLLTRALTLIRVHFTDALREIAADVAKRIADRQLNDTTMSALLYAKFRVGAPDLKAIGIEVQKRAVLPPGAALGAEAEYQSLMNELYQSYSTTRGRLILPIVTKKIAEIAQAPSTSKDLVSFARSSISYIKAICLDECNLWRQWFDGDGGLYDFLEAMCEPLYDHLRPRTIHETQILKLCELCTLLQTRYMDEDEDGDEEDEEDVEEGIKVGGAEEEEEQQQQDKDEDNNNNNNNKNNKNLPVQATKLNFPLLVHPALEDAQNRLVFLSLAILRDDIERYKPKAEDLDYPAKNKKQRPSRATPNQPALSGKKQPKTDAPPTPLMPKTPTIVDEDDPDARWNFNTEAAFADWYPTLRKAIWLLSKIYRLVHSSVFDDLAHHIVHSTTLSLTHASTLLSKSTSPTDAALFLISHLLLLKQQIVAFDIEFVTPETDVQYDFSSITNTFWELQSRGGLFNPRNLVNLLIPKVVENMLDAKAEVDARLRQAITNFTSQFVTRITAPITGKVPTQEAAARTAKVRQNVEQETPFLRRKLEEYVTDVRTREMLVAAVMESIAQVYDEWHATYVPLQTGYQNGNQNGVAAVATGRKGKGREDGVWDPEVFAEWCAGVFRVGVVRDVDSASGRESLSEGDSEPDTLASGTPRTGLRIQM